MKPLLRALLVIGGGSLLLGSDCMFGRPIVDDRSRYYPSDGVISCTGTRCADLPAYELRLPPALADSPCTTDLPSEELETALRAGGSVAGMRLTVSSERPLDFNLSAISLSDACVVVTGPVRLTIGAGSRLTRVAMLLGPAASVDAEPGARPAGRATPDIHLGHAQLEQVTLQAVEEDAPSGSVQLEFANCSQCETRVDSLNVIESQVQNSRLGADSLTLVGGAFDTVELAFEYGLLAGVLANDLRTEACNTLSLVGATITGRASKIGPCDCGLTSSGEQKDAGSPSGASSVDASEPRIAPPPDAGPRDGGAPGFVPFEAGPPEAGAADASRVDAELADAVVADASSADAELAEAGAVDASAADATAPDAGAADAAQVIALRGDAGYGGGGPDSEACLGATITQSTFFGGMVDGKVRAENSTFRSVLFARHANTSLDMWSTNIELSVTCDHLIYVRLDKTSTIGCSSCDEDATVFVCKLDREPKLTVNQCESFGGRLNECVPPLPTRSSPPVPMPPKLGT